jgi:hypothetical protein
MGLNMIMVMVMEILGPVVVLVRGMIGVFILIIIIIIILTIKHDLDKGDQPLILKLDRFS